MTTFPFNSTFNISAVEATF